MKKFRVVLMLTAAVLLTACGAVQNKNHGEIPKIMESSQEATAERVVKKDSFVAFSTKTLDGDSVDESRLSGVSLNFVNCWATFCGPCIEEMPDLEALSQEYTQVRFIGVVTDAYDDRYIAMAKDILADTGVTYLQLVPSADLDKICLDDMQYVPTTYLVDNQGNIVASFVGSRSKAEWKEIIDEALTSLP